MTEEFVNFCDSYGLPATKDTEEIANCVLAKVVADAISANLALDGTTRRWRSYLSYHIEKTQSDWGFLPPQA